jgi:hypothetical protein
MIVTLVFKKNAKFFSENWEKIVILRSGHIIKNAIVITYNTKKETKPANFWGGKIKNRKKF